MDAAPRQSAATRQPRRPPPRTRNGFAQLRTLFRRYLAVIASDRVYLGVLVGLPIVLGRCSIRVIPSPRWGWPGLDNAGRDVAAAGPGGRRVLAGAANAVRELVKERAIYSGNGPSGCRPARTWSRSW